MHCIGNEAEAMYVGARGQSELWKTRGQRRFGGGFSADRSSAMVGMEVMVRTALAERGCVLETGQTGGGIVRPSTQVRFHALSDNQAINPERTRGLRRSRVSSRALGPGFAGSGQAGCSGRDP